MADWPLLSGQQAVMYGQDGANSFLVAITGNATAHTKGAYVELIASSPFSSHGIMITFTYAQIPYIFLVDVAVGGAGSEQVIIPDLAVHSPTSGGHIANRYFFPLNIPSGSRISARCQSSTGAKYVRIGIHLLNGGFAQPTPFNSVQCFGLAGSSRGASVDPGGTTNTKGAYTQIAASLTNPLKGLVLAVGGQLNDARVFTEWLADIAIGGAGSEQIIVPNIPLVCSDTTDKITPETTPFIPFSIPAGSRLAVRAQCTSIDAADRLFDAFIYGVV